MLSQPQVLILGGGFAALESAFLLRMRLHDSVDIRLVSDRHHFTSRPNSIYVPFGAAPASLLIGLHKPMRRRHIDFVEGSAAEVDADSRLVTLLDGQRLRYDKLIVATGADTNAGEIPGLQEHAATIWTPDSMLEVRRRFQQARDAARRGERQRVLFLVPPNNKCSGPLYEIVFMLETWLRREHARDHVESDERGFVQTELETRLVTGRDDIYAPGDAGDFPIKQAFLAFLQADTVADHIAAEVTGAPFRSPFDSVSMCIMEMFDTATFAQVPVELTGDPEMPVRVRPDADGDYKVGTSPAWRLGKKMLGFSVPMRFAVGEPFHAGKAWQGMEIGIKAMSSMLAD